MIEKLKLSKKARLYCLIILLIIIFALVVALPSLGRFQSKLVVDNAAVWDKTVASSYRDGKGTKEDPYQISNGSELALFAKSLETTDYSNTYFSIENDIVINDGYFIYDNTNKLQYFKDDITYYVKEYSNEIYDNPNREGTVISNINNFSPLNNFKGYIDGNNHTIYGLYIRENDTADLSFFTNFEGNVSSLFFANSVIYGGNNTAFFASNTENATISNLIYDGYVISNNTPNTLNTTISLDDITLTSSNEIITEKNIDVDGIITNVTLTGSVNNLNNLTINGNSITTNDFSIDLDNYNTLEIKTNNYQNTTLSNLKYEVTYITDSTAGLISKANNTTLTNVVNKADIYGNGLSSGLIGNGSNIKISNSYNNGSITSLYLSTGLVGSINEKSSITNSYNSGNLNSPNNIGLIGSVKSSILDITNCFNASNSNYLINNNINSTININNSYYIEGEVINTGDVIGTFYLTDITNLKNKYFLINTLLYKEFVDLEDLESNKNNLFVYNNTYPLLYFDEESSSNAIINLGKYSYNNFSNDLKSVKFKDNININITDASSLMPNKEIYYYIYKGNEALSRDEVEVLDFSPYQGVLEITEMGKYIIYVKTVDYDNNISYINTDILVLDKTDASININMNDLTYNSYNQSVDEIYTNKSQILTVSATDDLSFITDIKYYVSSDIKTKEELDKIEFIPYDKKIVLDNIGKNIVYVKVVDNYNDVTYANTDYINIDGYNVNSIDNTNITDKSSVNLNIIYESDKDYLEGYSHSLVSNTLLPKDTIITLIDNNSNKVYTYTVSDTEKTSYDFSSFKEIGKDDNTTFKEIESGKIKENYSVKLSFENTNIKEDMLDINLSLVLKDKNNDIVLDTLENTLKSFNIYKEKDASISLTAKNTISNINYNSDSLTELEFITKLDYQQINNNNIIDTTYQDKGFILLMKLIDDAGNIVNKEDLKNISFTLNDTKYYPDSNGYIRINLSNDMNDYTNKLAIQTSIDNSTLTKGIYHFSINTASSKDGIYEDVVSSDTIEIPVIVDNHLEDYSFNVENISSKIINKEKKEQQLDFNITKKIETTEGNIRVALYKKKNFTAFNQDYELIDLNEYITNDLELVNNKVYYAYKSPLEYQNTLGLKFIPSKLESGGYKLVFELYDNNTKIGTLDEKFIVK